MKYQIKVRLNQNCVRNMIYFFTDDSLVEKLVEMIQNLSDKVDSMEEKLLQQGE